jgi:outer membrane protein assembly factor BamB
MMAIERQSQQNPGMRRAVRALVPIGIASWIVSLAASGQPESAESLVGTWAGQMEHDGETSPVALEFVKRESGVHAVLVVPAFHGRSPLGPVKMNGRTVELAMMTLDYDRAAARLSVTLPKGLVPRYEPRMTFTRSATPFALPARSDPTAPRRTPVWTADLGAPIWADALYHDHRVFVGADDGQLRAIDARSGSVVWTFAAGGAIRARAAIEGADLFVQSDNGLLHRIDATTGTLRWQVRIAGTPAARLPLSDPKGRYENRASAAALHGGRAFVGTHEGRLLALDTATGERVWEFKAGDSITTTPAIADGKVYFGSFDRHVYAIAERDGALAWKYDTGEAVTSDVAPTAGRVIVGSRSYDLESLDASRGTAQWKKYFWFSWVESSPIVFKDTIYVGSSDAAKVFAIDVATGRSVWEADALGSAWGRPAVTESTVFQGSAGVLRYSAPHRGVVLAFDRRTGRVGWWYEAAPPVPRDPVPPQTLAYGFAASVAIGDGLVFAPGLDGRVYAFAQ